MSDTDEDERIHPHEPDYNCPDCEYHKSGITTGPHAYISHLMDEHGYERSEAFEILHD